MAHPISRCRVFPRAFLALATCFIALAVTATPTLAVDIVRGPYLQLLTPDSVTIRWRTDVASDSAVHYGAAPETLGLTASDAASVTDHEVTLTGLAALTRYYYAVGSSTETLAGGDADHTFETAPNSGAAKPTRIWVLGDSGTADANAGEVRDRYKERAADEYPADLMLMLGDNAYEDGTDQEYQAAIFDTYPTILTRTPLWPTIGNHDDRNIDVYYDAFTLPTAAEAGGAISGTEDYYSFDYANIHFISLNSELDDLSPAAAVWTWLTNDLAASDQDWTIAFWHHPPYTKGSHDSDIESRLIAMRENAVPILEDAGVDLVLTGHSHSYERSHLLDGHYGLSGTLDPSMTLDLGGGREDGAGAFFKPNIAAPHEGTVYAVAGSSGDFSGGLSNHPAMFIALNRLGSMILDIYADSLDAIFLDDTGAAADYFTILKGPDVTPPTVIAANAVAYDTVKVFFAEPVTAPSATAPANYAIDGGISVTGANLATDGRSVLVTTTALSNGDTYTVTVAGVEDAAGLAVPPGTTATFAYQTVVERSFQDGAAPTNGYAGSQDTYIHEDPATATTNFGHDAALFLDGDDPGGSSNDLVAFLAWDISSIPVGAIVEGATITIDVIAVSNRAYEIYQSLRPWTESGATWMTADGTTTWGTPGAAGAADRGTTQLGAVTGPTIGKHTITLNPDGLAVLQSWVDGALNHGFVIANESNTDGLDFRSREAADATDRPRLDVTYQLLPGSPNSTPTADAQDITTAKDTGVPITLTGNDADGDPLSFSVSAGPANGTLSGASPNLTYTPDSGYSGSDSFTFKANDGQADSADATVAIAVTTVIFSLTDISLTKAANSETQAVDATGFKNLTVSFKVQGTGSVNPGCGSGGSSDCWQLWENSDPIVGSPGLDIPISETDFGPFLLASADTTFDLTFVIVVTGSNEGAEFRMITVEGDAISPPPNNAPSVTITGPADGTGVVAGTELTFTGTANDGEDGDLGAGLAWSSDIDGGFGTGASVPAILSLGIHAITASVTDSGGLPGSDQIIVTIVANAAPVVAITAPADGTDVVAGTELTFTGTANDSEDGDLGAGLAWTSDIDGALGTGPSAPAILSLGVHTITASVTGSGGLPGNAEITVTIVANAAPAVAVTGPADGTGVVAGTEITFTGTASDTEDGDLGAGLAWSSNLDGGFGTGASVPAILSLGVHTITASVTDSGGLPGSDQIIVTIVANAAPVVAITAPADGTSVVAGTELTFTGTAGDSEDGDLGAGLAWTSDIDGALGTGPSAPAILSLGVHTITASVTDSGGLPGNAESTVTIVANIAPAVAVTAPADGTGVVAGTEITFAGTASDSEDGDLGAGLAWSSNLDGGLGTGASVPAILSVGVHTITASVTDSGGLAGNAEITVTVAANTAPGVTITAPADGTGVVEGTELTFTGTAGDSEDGDLGANLAWSSDIDGGFGTGASVPAILSVGVHTITASVTDSGGLPGSAEITATVAANTAPAVAVTGPADGTGVVAGTELTFTGTASDTEDGDLGANLAWSSDIDGGFGTGASVPAILSVGVHTITASVTDSGGLAGNAEITVTVTALPSTAPHVTIIAPADGTSAVEGTEITFAGTAIDNEEGDLSASLSWSSNKDGALGTGASVGATLSKGRHAITATVTDSGGLSGNGQIIVRIKKGSGPQQ